MEGNFNTALLLTMDDKRQVIAKFPCSNAGPPHYTTASEVAALEFSMYPVLHVLQLQRPDCVTFSSITDINPSSEGLGLGLQQCKPRWGRICSFREGQWRSPFGKMEFRQRS